jgi:hypothetical protein
MKMMFKKNKETRWLKWLFPVTGLLSLIWFLVRVVPKPTRASYPCQRVAGPMAGTFLLWLTGLVSSTFLFRKVRDSMRQWRIKWAVICLAFLAAAGAVTIVTMPEEPVIAANSEANTPIGTAKGIHPGRVVWAYDPDATDWQGFNSSEHWWESNHTDLNVVKRMVSQVIRGVAGESTDAAAWDAIFRYNNQNRGKGDIGYQAGEKITIKLNLTTCNARSNQVDPHTYDKNPDVMNRIDNSPQIVLVLLRHLVNTVGVAPGDITVGDPTGMVPNFYWNMLHPEFPNVKYWDNYGGSGRTRAEFSTVPFYWSTSDANGKLQDYLPEAVVEADYLINFAVLKGHSAGVSLCGKNHYGTLIRCPDGYLRDHGNRDYYNTHLCLPTAVWAPGKGHYRAHVDLMGHPEIGEKTILYLLDGLFSGYYWEAVPVKWTSSPFGDEGNGDWPSSIFGSQDPVAIDSVGYDFLLAEWPDVVLNGDGASLQGGADDYLHEAAQADNPPSGTFYDPDNNGTAMSSLGVHEHWNNATDKQYSRNLGTGEGIELFRISNLSGSPGEIALNRHQLNFAYVINGELPPSQSFSISNTGTGTVSWIAAENTSWLSCIPTSGTNTGKLTVSVNPTGLGVGTYTSTITVTDLNTAGSYQSLAINLKIYASGSDSAPIGAFDTPIDGSTVRSSIPVTGWVLDDVHVESVKIYRQQGRDLVYIGEALFVDGARPDIETAYPTYPLNYKAGWGYMMLTNFLPNNGNGPFVFHAIATDSTGHHVTLGTKTVTCDNVNAVKPFGAIDTPAPGGEASGSGFIVHGWALTPMPNKIPVDGSTLNVYVDGKDLGHPVYNNYRADIASLFPGYANSNGAHGYFKFDTTAFSNGVHTIYWIATDNAGNSDGIGSRYFTIQNSHGAWSMAHEAKHRGSPTWSPNPGGIPYISKVPIDYLSPVGVIKGYKRNVKPLKSYPDKKGNIMIEINELQPLEIRLFPVGAGGLAPLYSASPLEFIGYMVVGNQIRALPIGSTLDTEKGIFYWYPGPGFIGKYQLVFVAKTEIGTFIKRSITIKIAPKFSNEI